MDQKGKPKTENLEETRIVSTQNKVRVLVADPDKEIFSQIQESRPDDSYEFIFAPSSWSVIETLMGEKFDIIVSDMDSRGANFLETVAYTTKHYPMMVQIIMSAENNVDNAVWSMRNGAFDFLVKPFKNDRMREGLAEAVKYRKQLLIDSVSGKSKAEEINLHTLNILPDYTPVRVIGAGASGIVLHLRRNRINYALKILHKELLESHSAAERFSREAGLLARIDHPNVIRVFESGVAKESQTPFILMEYVEGKPLAQLIMERKVSAPDGFWILRQAANALRAIHASNVIHRDVKPGNIMVKENKQIKLMDFGLAKTLDSELTMGDKAIGTPAYMAPEVFSEKMEYSDRYDIFALGITIYETLVGQKPFQGETFAEMAEAIIKSHPSNPRRLNPSLPTGIEHILARMLAKRPSKRPSSAELCVLLDDYSANGPDILATPFWEKVGVLSPWS